MNEKEMKTELPKMEPSDPDISFDTEKAEIEAADIPAEEAESIDTEETAVAEADDEDDEDVVPATFATVKVFSKEKQSGQIARRETKTAGDASKEERGSATVGTAKASSSQTEKPQTRKRRAIFDGFTLKMIAVVTMLIDHSAAVFLNGAWKEEGFGDPVWAIYNIMRLIGRFAFPIFCFLLVEGFFHTRSRLKYALRLAIFAVISEIPFDLALADKSLDLPDRILAWNKQNVFITLLIGFLVIWSIEWWLRPWIEQKKAPKTFGEISKFFFPMLGFVILGGLAAVFTNCDYGLGGIIVIVFIYFSHGEQHPGMNMIRSSIILAFLSSRTELIVLAGYPLTEFYSEQRGRSWKWFFYVFYPAHLLLLFLLYKLI